ncbi:MAG: hypothetical protein OEM29_09080 [Thermoplasmata archaeon]|nr:hypothetical protein [Thermoplasmata archaeon]
MAIRLNVSYRHFMVAAVAVGTAVILVFAVYVIAFSPITVTGTVDHKMIVGIRDDAAYKLVQMAPLGLTVYQQALVSLFADKDGNVTINESMEWEIMSCGYSEIRYLASMRVSTGDSVNHIDPGGTLGYFVKRSDFNALKLTESFTFEVEKSEPATIRKLD